METDLVWSKWLTLTCAHATQNTHSLKLTPFQMALFIQ